MIEHGYANEFISKCTRTYRLSSRSIDSFLHYCNYLEEFIYMKLLISKRHGKVLFG